MIGYVAAAWCKLVSSRSSYGLVQEVFGIQCIEILINDQFSARLSPLNPHKWDGGSILRNH